VHAGIAVQHNVFLQSGGGLSDFLRCHPGINQGGVGTTKVLEQMKQRGYSLAQG
jgi:hypothetical protein